MRTLYLLLIGCVLAGVIAGCSPTPQWELCCEEPLLCSSESDVWAVKSAIATNDPSLLDDLKTAGRIVPGERGEVVLPMNVVESKYKTQGDLAIIQVHIPRLKKDAWIRMSCLCKRK